MPAPISPFINAMPISWTCPSVASGTLLFTSLCILSKARSTFMAYCSSRIAIVAGSASLKASLSPGGPPRVAVQSRQAYRQAKFGTVQLLCRRSGRGSGSGWDSGFRRRSGRGSGSGSGRGSGLGSSA